MARLARIARHRWGVSLTSLTAALSGLILTDVLAPAPEIQSWLVITGLVTIPVLLRVVRGSRAKSEAVMLERVCLQRGRHSRFLDCQLTRSLKKLEPFLEVGEDVIVELHRHPLALISLSLIGSMLLAIAKGAWVVIRLAFSSVYAFAGVAIGLVLLAVITVHLRYWILGGFAVTVVLVALMIFRFWRVQTVVVTNWNMIRFEGLHARPSKLPRSDEYELQVSTPMSACIATRLRVVKVPWDNVDIYRVYWSTDKLTGQRIKTTKHIAVIKALTGARVVLESDLFASPHEMEPSPKQGV